VLLIQSDQAWILNPEFQSSRSPDIEARMLTYAALLIRRYSVPVHTVLVLLRPEADAPGLNGAASWQAVDAQSGIMFRYQIVRLWQEPPERFLSGGIGSLPVAVVTASDEHTLDQVAQAIENRLRTEDKSQADEIRLASYILSGLRHSPETVNRVYERVAQMNLEDSSTYRYLMDKLAEREQQGVLQGMQQGRADEAQRILFNLGTDRLGDPLPRVRKQIEKTKDLDKLEAMIRRVASVQSWRELLN
jgi:hypothetical protein